MDITPLIPKESKVVQSYDSKGFMISSEHFEGSIFLTPDSVHRFPVLHLNDLQQENIRMLDQLDDIEVLLIGTGKAMRFIPSLQRDKIKELTGKLPEPMDTGAACRTYNTLLADGRRVGALLFPYQ